MSEDRGERIRRPRGRKPRRKVCDFCVNKIQHIDYKDVNRLRRFTSERGKILPHDRHLRQAPAPAVHRHQARPDHRPDALRVRLIEGKKLRVFAELF